MYHVHVHVHVHVYVGLNTEEKSQEYRCPIRIIIWLLVLNNIDMERVISSYEIHNYVSTLQICMTLRMLL